MERSPASRSTLASLLAAAFCLSLCAGFKAVALEPGPRPDEPAVSLSVKGGRAQLQRDGRPYFVKGAGGLDDLEALAKAGGNSIRTWSVDDSTAALLDKAHKNGLTVTLGLWLRRTGGMDYGDEAALARQIDSVTAAVKRYREHPALLFWALGNEMEGEGDDPRVYEQLERLAQLVHALDPEHPTLTVIAELGGGQKVEDLNRLAPSIDVIGINSYGSAGTVGERYRAAGGERPYMLTEFGARGHWESPRTPAGLPIEETSTKKAEHYRSAYRGSVANQPLCLGSYAFLWGDKQETTATWYGMLLPDGSRLAAVDAMTELWSGKPPKNRCPEIKSIQGLPGARDLKVGESFKVSVAASDPERNRLSVEWVLRAASAGNGSYGQREDRLPDFPRAIVNAKGLKATLRLVVEPGSYRLFAYVRDGKGGAAVHNVPIQVHAD